MSQVSTWIRTSSGFSLFIWLELIRDVKIKMYVRWISPQVTQPNQDEKFLRKDNQSNHELNSALFWNKNKQNQNYIRLLVSLNKVDFVLKEGNHLWFLANSNYRSQRTILYWESNINKIFARELYSFMFVQVKLTKTILLSLIRVGFVKVEAWSLFIEIRIFN